MATQYASLRNMQFLLNDVLNVGQLTAYPYFAGQTAEEYGQIVEAAKKFADSTLWPLFAEMARTEAEFENGEVVVHPAIPGLMRAYGEGGWLVTSVPAQHGGLQLPGTIENACGFFFGAANKIASQFPGLTTGAARLIQNFGDQQLRDTYLPHMHQGRWQGTMCLTEPQAGSSLSDIVATATPAPDGTYKIKGQKIFISAGDYKGADNIVHLVIAKIPGEPAGTKGISLFVVPKLRPEGDKLVPNDVKTIGVYHKMGERGTPACHLIFGDTDECVGYLVGAKNQGLPYMFQMMNEARLGVGLGAAALVSAAYYAALEYARERPQGREVGNRDVTQPQVPIIEHADVRRMLLFQKAVTEGGIALCLQCLLYADLAMVTDGEASEDYELLLELLTPLAKTFPAEWGLKSISDSVQTFGGYGFTRDFPAEQYFRDIKISSLYEGTTGIQGMDLLGRKVLLKNGKALQLFATELGKTLTEASNDAELSPFVAPIQKAAGHLQQVTLMLLGTAQSGQTKRFLADATLYLDAFSVLAISWLWLKQGIAARKGLVTATGATEKDFFEGKLATLRYWVVYELPKVHAVLGSIEHSEGLTVDLDTAVIV